jgi:hypothetical protein
LLLLNARRAAARARPQVPLVIQLTDDEKVLWKVR